MSYFFVGNKEHKEIYTDLNINEFSYKFFEIFEKELKNGYIKNIKTTRYSVIYKATFGRFAWHGWNLFNGISGGSVFFKEKENKIFIEYKIYFYEYLVYCLLFSLIPILAYSPNYIYKVYIAISIWVIYFALGIVSIIRFNRFIAKTIKSTKFEMLKKEKKLF